jgi:Kef-type K+ transport system membrane component KefB
MNIGAFLMALIAIFVAAKLFGELAGRLGQPAVLGELIGGLIPGAVRSDFPMIFFGVRCQAAPLHSYSPSRRFMT